MKKWLPILAVALAAAPPALGHSGFDIGVFQDRDLNDVTQNKNAYIIGYAHLDTQWRWSYIDTIRDYIPKTLHDNFALFEKYPDYVFNFTGSRRYRMMREYYPKDYETLKEYVRKGRWYPTGSSVDENDVNVPSWESHIRNTLYGNDYFQKEFGLRPIDFILPDCFGFPASLPSILNHVGAKGFSTQKLTWGSAAGIPFTVGVWEGPDGRSVVAALDAGAYVSKVTEDLSESNFLLNRINKVGDRSGAYVDYRYYGTGDTGGAPDEASVAWVSKSMSGSGAVNVIGGAADQMFMDLKPENIARMERYKGDLELTEHSAGSLTSQAYMKRWNRKNELLADATERAAVGAHWLGGMPYPMAKMVHSWELILGGQMHDILPGTSIPEAYEQSWNDEIVALNQSASALQAAVGAVTRALDTRATGVSVVVYNPLSIEREDVVEARVEFPRAAPQFVRVFGPDGKEVPSQVLSRYQNAARVLFLGRVPSVGFAAFDVRPSNVPSAVTTGIRATANSLENGRYRVSLNSAGDVAQIQDKAANRNLLSGPARLAFKFEEPREWPAWNIDWDDQRQPPVAYVSGPAKIRVVENGPVRVAVEIERETMGSRFVQRVRLSANDAGDRVEFDNKIDWHTRKHTLKTEFPLAVSNDKATYNLGLGTIERPNNHPKEYEVVSHQWFDLTDKSGNYGVTVLEDSKFGSDKPDDNTLRLTLVRTPGARSYRDQATQDLGQHEVLYALSGHTGDWRKGKSPWQGARLNQPLAAFQAPSRPGAFGKTLSLFKVNTDQVMVNAIKKAENSDEIIVRLVELNGSPARNVRLSAAAPILSARELNGQELPIGPATVSNGALAVDMDGYHPRTFALKLGAPAVRLSAPVSRPVDLAYNMAAASRDGEKVAKGFDGYGHMYSADLMPTTLNLEGVTFRLAPGGANRKSAVAAQGQRIALPGGAHTQLYILASAVNGDHRGTFRVDNRPTTLTVQDWGGYIGQWDNRVWPTSNTGAKLTEGDIVGLRPAYIKRDTLAWVGEHRHKGDGTNDFYAYSYIYKYRLPIPAGAKTLTLPNNENIRVFAVTVATNPNDDTQPAGLLYDSFEPRVASPVASPASGSYNNTVEVTLGSGPYLTAGARVPDTLRYTTDGSNPTASSPIYREPLMISRTTTLKVRPFGANGQAGAITTARYDVRDVTPPAINRAIGSGESNVIQVVYSEPVDRASAERAANYEVSPGTEVRSARLRPDGRSVNLTVSPSLVSGRAYTLSVNGVKDKAPAANTLRAASVEFPAATAVFRFGVGSEGTGVATLGGSDVKVTTMGQPATATGPGGPALAFAGSPDALSVANAPGLNPTISMTVTAWFRPTSWSGKPRILQKGRSDSQYRLFAEDGKLQFDVAGIGAVSAPQPSLNEWHHVAATYDGAYLRIYLDGKQAGEVAASGPLPTTNGALFIGTKGTDSQSVDFFKGEIAEVTLYDDAALLPEHIQNLYALRGR